MLYLVSIPGNLLFSARQLKTSGSGGGQRWKREVEVGELYQRIIILNGKYQAFILFKTLTIRGCQKKGGGMPS